MISMKLSCKEVCAWPDDSIFSFAGVESENNYKQRMYDEERGSSDSICNVCSDCFSLVYQQNKDRFLSSSKSLKCRKQLSTSLNVHEKNIFDCSFE